MWSVSTNRGEGARSGVRPKLAAVTPPLLRNAVRRGLAVSRRVGYARARWPRPFGTRPAIQLAVCAIFKNEARYLAEWVTFHRLMGVQHFSLYNNGSADDWVRELIPELDAGDRRGHSLARNGAAAARLSGLSQPASSARALGRLHRSRRVPVLPNRQDPPRCPGGVSQQLRSGRQLAHLRAEWT